MKRLISITVFITALSFVSLGGCGTTTGSFATSVIIQGTKPGSLSTMRSMVANLAASLAQLLVLNTDGSLGGTLTLSDARLSLKEIKLKRNESGLSETEKEDDNQVKYRGPFIVDLISNTVTPSLGSLILASGTYDRIELKLAKIEDEAGESGSPLVSPSDNLYRKSIYLAGTYTGSTNGGSVTDAPFTLSFELDEEFALAAGSRGFSLQSNATNTVIIAFRLAKWLAFNNTTVNDKNVDFRNIITNAGRIDLSDASEGDNKKIWEVMREAVKASADFGRDSNDDGRLESSEDDDVDSEDESDD